MIKYLDPIEFNDFRLSNEFNKMLNFSLLEGKRIGWNYPLDYSFIVLELKKIKNLKNKKIVDIGCGPGAVHGYLEDLLGVDIIGVDQKHWEKDYVDLIGDFSDEDFRRKNNLNNIDVIISSSAFEHNSPSNHQKLLKACKKAMTSGGVLITTSAANSKNYNSKFRKSFQVNLSPSLVQKIYGEKIQNLTEYNNIRKRYIEDDEISTGYKKRFNKDIKSLNFLALGAVLLKENIPEIYDLSFFERFSI